MNDSDFRRAAELMASRTEQKLDDFLYRYERDQAMSKEWREAFVKRLEPLERLNEKLKTPLQVFIWVCAAVFGGVGISVWKWVERHWQ